MSTPHERMRALGWGLELLMLMGDDATIPVDCRDQARSLSLRYPVSASLKELLASGTKRLPPEVGSSMDDARRLFEKLQRCGAGTAATRHVLLYTLRHFPLRSACDWADACDGGLQAWLQPDGPDAPDQMSERLRIATGG